MQQVAHPQCSAVRQPATHTHSQRLGVPLHDAMLCVTTDMARAAMRSLHTHAHSQRHDGSSENRSRPAKRCLQGLGTFQWLTVRHICPCNSILLPGRVVGWGRNGSPGSSA